MSELITQNNTTNKDWHRADIIAELRKKGWSIRQLSFSHGYSNGTSLKTALDRPWPKGERIIADALGVSVEDIWPERFAVRKLKKFAPTFRSKLNALEE